MENISISTVVSIVALALAIWAEIRARTAKQAAAAARAELYTYVAATEFAAASRLAYEMTIVVQAGDWNTATRQAAQTASGVAKATGGWLQKLSADETNAVTLLQAEISQWPHLLPYGDDAPNRDHVRLVLEQATTAITTLETISARIHNQFLQRNGE
jgi:hypothetical protein